MQLRAGTQPGTGARERERQRERERERERKRERDELLLQVQTFLPFLGMDSFEKTITKLLGVSCYCSST